MRHPLVLLSSSILFLSRIFADAYEHTWENLCAQYRQYAIELALPQIPECPFDTDEIFPPQLRAGAEAPATVNKEPTSSPPPEEVVDYVWRGTSEDAPNIDPVIEDKIVRFRDRAAEVVFQKIANAAPFSRMEKIILLKSENLAVKAIVAPESITPAERNRILRRPPPDEVKKNILLATDGVLSRPEDLEQKIIHNPRLATDVELNLVRHGFSVCRYYCKEEKAYMDKSNGPDGTMGWIRKWAELSLLDKTEMDAFFAAKQESERMERVQKRVARMNREKVDTLEQCTLRKALEGELKLLRRDAEDEKQVGLRKEYDEWLLAEAAKSMLLMVKELYEAEGAEEDEREFWMDICVGVYGTGVCERDGDQLMPVVKGMEGGMGENNKGDVTQTVTEKVAEDRNEDFDGKDDEL